MLTSSRSLRRGAVAPVFAMILPALFILASMAINIAYMQLVSTEMKIAADCCAHAGGRAMSIEQTTADAITKARELAQLNLVGGKAMELTTVDEDMEFGLSTRIGVGRFDFTPHTQADVDSGAKRATSFAVNGTMDVPMIFLTLGGIDSVAQSRRSVATQVDRDISLVLDRSGSMLYYENETALTAALALLRDTEIMTEGTDDVVKWHYYKKKTWDSKKKKWKYEKSKGYYAHEEISAMGNGWVFDPDDSIMIEGEEPQGTGEYMITEEEYNEATRFLYDRRYSQNVINQLATINIDMSEYTDDWETMIESDDSWWDRSPAPRHSRWAFLVDGVDAFLTVLEGTVQDELITLVVFNNSATSALNLGADYQAIRDYVADIVPYEGTNIADGLTKGRPELMSGANARIFAAKTIVIMTDGEKSSGTADPKTTVENMVAVDPITVHSLTFATDNATAKADMKAAAEAGNGTWYHANTGPDLVAKFREIANNLPTILTE